MILIDNDKNKFSAIECAKPKFNSGKNYWDFAMKNINGEEYKFYFTVRANRSYFYFNFKEKWYKVNIVNSKGIDLFDYLDELKILDKIEFYGNKSC